MTSTLSFEEAGGHHIAVVLAMVQACQQAGLADFAEAGGIVVPSELYQFFEHSRRVGVFGQARYLSVLDVPDPPSTSAFPRFAQHQRLREEFESTSFLQRSLSMHDLPDWLSRSRDELCFEAGGARG